MGPPATEWLLRSALWLCLGGWVGAYALFAFVVAPTAFRVLPSPGDAGQLVGPVLRALHLYGLGAGAVLGALAWLLGRRGVAIWLPICLAAMCGFSEFVISSEIVSVRPRDFGPASAPDAAARFSMLHQTSRVLFGVTLAGAMALVILHARADSSRRPVAPSGALSP